MAKELMNEAERYLLQTWSEARSLEEAMEAVRTKYKELYRRVLDALAQAHPELDVSVVYVTQFWGKGSVGLGRKSWPGADGNWPAGFWVWDLRLEVLAEENSERPASIYVPKKHYPDNDAARAAVNKAAQELLTPDEFKGIVREDSGENLIWLPGPTSGQLMSAIVDGDGEKFVRIFVDQFEMMAKFVPVLDQVFRDHLAR